MWVICRQTKLGMKYVEYVDDYDRVYYGYDLRNAKTWSNKTDAEIAMQYHNITGYEVVKV